MVSRQTKTVKRGGSSSDKDCKQTKIVKERWFLVRQRLYTDKDCKREVVSRQTKIVKERWFLVRQRLKTDKDCKREVVSRQTKIVKERWFLVRQRDRKREEEPCEGFHFAPQSFHNVLR